VEGDTDRFSITLTNFTIFELDDLVNIHAPSRARVAAHAIEQWLHDNEDKIALRKARDADFVKTRSKTSKPVDDPMTPRERTAMFRFFSTEDSEGQCSHRC